MSKDVPGHYTGLADERHAKHLEEEVNKLTSSVIDGGDRIMVDTGEEGEWIMSDETVNIGFRYNNPEYFEAKSNERHARMK